MGKSSRHVKLVGGFNPTPLKNMSSSVGMMKFPTYGKIKFMFQTTNQISMMIRTQQSQSVVVISGSIVDEYPGCPGCSHHRWKLWMFISRFTCDRVKTGI
jgi:hypothetical protein